MRFGAELTRLELRCEDALGRHDVSVGFKPGETKRLQRRRRAGGEPDGATARPLVSVFLPDRLELVLGAPALRRAHLDQVVAALWPSRAETRRSYSAALAQRNALLAAIRAGRASRASLPAWDAELARHGVALMADRAGDRRPAAPALCTSTPQGLGLEGEVELRYRPRSTGRRPPRSWPRSSPSASTPTSSAASPATARTATTSPSGARAASCAPTARAASSASGCSRCCWPSGRSWPHAHGAAPLLLLDDVMSELDATRRGRLVELLRRDGQAVITTTELAHVPGGDEADVTRIAIADGDGPAEAGARARGRRMKRRPGRGRSPSRSSTLADQLEPPTLLAAVQRVWPAAAGCVRERRRARLRARRVLPSRATAPSGRRSST